MIIRRAEAGDAEALAGIHRYYVRETLVTFTTEEKPLKHWQEGLRNGPPVFLAVAAGKVLGYGTYGAFRAGPGYARTAEHSVYLAPGETGRGAGRRLLAAVEAAAAAAGIEVMVAGISGANPEAVAFHARLGYRETGRLVKVGQKAGRRLDLVLMQKNLPQGGDPG